MPAPPIDHVPPPIGDSSSLFLYNNIEVPVHGQVTVSPRSITRRPYGEDARPSAAGTRTPTSRLRRERRL